ncbi:hypothetical protein V2I21_06270 [Campylobacter sp. CLAX-22107-21]|uniref:hypothetical protein n=1 Tax=Campylobacter devanensis TaxID=3161138 RepID=UPI002EA54650|nr:hypothetical protein [Campylobacter sp. CLAX-22107-21]
MKKRIKHNSTKARKISGALPVFADELKGYTKSERKMIKKGLKTKEQIDKEWDEFWADAAHEND